MPAVLFPRVCAERVNVDAVAGSSLFCPDFLGGGLIDVEQRFRSDAGSLLLFPQGRHCYLLKRLTRCQAPRDLEHPFIFSTSNSVVPKTKASSRSGE
jgi:hypothetical protein